MIAEKRILFFSFCLAAPLTALARQSSIHMRGEVALQLCQLADTLPPSLAAAHLIGSAHLSCACCAHMYSLPCNLCLHLPASFALLLQAVSSMLPDPTSNADHP